MKIKYGISFAAQLFFVAGLIFVVGFSEPTFWAGLGRKIGNLRDTGCFFQEET